MSTQLFYRGLSETLSGISFTPTPAVAWGNEEYKPVKGTPFLQPQLLSEGETPLSTGPIQTRVNKLFVVNCWVDERDGYDEAYRLADTVSALFFPTDGTLGTITSGSLKILIHRKPEINPLDAHGGFVGAAALIRCFALI